MSPDGPGRRLRRRATRLAAVAVPAILLALSGYSEKPGAAAIAAAKTGIEGVTALRGELVGGVQVLVFDRPGPGPDTAPLALSEKTGADGRFQLDLAPGSYHVVAIRSAGAPWPFSAMPGDLFGYYLGNPVLVEAGKQTRVAFNLVRAGAPPPPPAGEGSGIAGRVLFEDKPLARAHVQVYRDAGTNFRGLGLASAPTGEDGSFRIKLPPGSYYVVARKRRAGGMYGPPGKDDYVGYHPGNPVTVSPGKIVPLRLETATRIDALEMAGPELMESAGWLEGSVIRNGGGPAAGLYVLFYADVAMAGTPAFVAGPTDAEGRFRVRSAAGTFHLVARSRLGGPLEAGEWHGTATLVGGAPRAGGGIRISVTRYQGK